MKCLIVTSRHGLLNWYPTFLLYAFSLSVLDLQFGFQLYFYNAVFHVVECGLEADQVSNFITRIQRAALRLFLFVWLGDRYDSRRLVMVTSSREGTMMPLEMLLAIAWLRLRESVLLVT